MGAWAFLAVTACVATKTLTFAQAFSAFTDEALWLIVVAFFFARVGSSDWALLKLGLITQHLGLRRVTACLACLAGCITQPSRARGSMPSLLSGCCELPRGR